MKKRSPGKKSTKQSTGKWLTIPEAARKAKVTKQAIYRAIETGELQAASRRIERLIRRVENVLMVHNDALRDYKPSASHQERGKKK